MFGKGRAAGNQLCSAAGDVMSLESKMGRELGSIISPSQELGMGNIHTNVRKSRTEGGRNKQTGRRRCWKPAGEQLFLGESRKDFAMRKAVASYFCTDLKVHRTQLWKLHVVFLAGNINIPYGETSAELYNIVWIWYWRIFIIEPALNCMFFSFDVLQMKQTHKTKKQNLKTTKEMHREIPISVFWIRLKINYLQYPVFISIYQTWWILDKRKRQETLYYCRYHGCCFSICREI